VVSPGQVSRLGILHSLKGAFDGYTFLPNDANSIEKTADGVVMNLGWFGHDVSHYNNAD